MGLRRKYLSADGLHQVVRHCVRRENLSAVIGSDYTWQDCVMSGLAIFGFKCPSLLQFEKAKTAEPMIRRNLRTLYQVEKAPSDTCLRERLDCVSPRQLRRPFKQIFSHLQRGKALESYRYFDGHYIVSVDGTGQYSSKKVHCKNCCEKKHRSGEVSYYHHLLGASIVHPDHKVVIPLAPEPIIKGDGSTKNDCERNASKRLLTDLRREHPHLKVLVVEDSLASNHPHLSLLDSLNMNYIIGAKPGDHIYLFEWIKDLKPHITTQQDDQGTEHIFRWYHDVPLNDAHHDYRVSVLDYTERKANGKEQHFSWVTKISLTADNVYQVMRAARARWRIENETFNTLKNQGYHFEHNYGHGKEHLCSTMTMLMMLAFLIDQVQQLCCKHYLKARQHSGAFKVLFESIRVLLKHAAWQNFTELLIFIGDPDNRAPPDGATWMAV
jgi:Transposase DDE domain